MQRVAKLRLAERIVIDQFDRMLFRQAAAQRRIFGHEEIVVLLPDRFEVQDLSQMPASRRGEAHLQPPAAVLIRVALFRHAVPRAARLPEGGVRRANAIADARLPE